MSSSMAGLGGTKKHRSHPENSPPGCANCKYMGTAGSDTRREERYLTPQVSFPPPRSYRGCPQTPTPF